MAIPKKGSRKIVVDGIEYRWYIRSRATDSQTMGWGLNIGVCLASDEPGTTLIVETGNGRLDCGGDEQAVIAPRHVEEVIRAAIQAGWRPAEKGSPFEFRYRVGEPLW